MDKKVYLEDMLDEIDEMLMRQGNFLAKMPEGAERDKALEQNANQQRKQLKVHQTLEALKSDVSQVWTLLKLADGIQEILSELFTED